MNDRNDLMKRLQDETQVFKNPEIRQAFEAIDRAHFVDGDYEVEAYEDYALPIRAGQTISQPTTVAFMLELLDPKSGDKILDVGSGSGWTTALLAHMVGKDGFVYGVELEPELVEVGKKNLKKYPDLNVEIRQATSGIGLPQKFLYDKILVNASAQEIPEELLAQLRPGGIMVVPVGEVLTQIIKKSDTEREKKEFPGFVFVPLR